jgi:hypothetical protein
VRLKKKIQLSEIGAFERCLSERTTASDDLSERVQDADGEPPQRAVCTSSTHST